MSLILVADRRENALLPDFGSGIWHHEFDQVIEGLTDAAAAEYDVVIPADHLRTPPRVASGINAAFLCTDLDGLDRALALNPPGDILFQPSALAWLDRHRQTRATLIAARFLDAGHRIAAGDLAQEVGGSGVSATLKATVIGRPLLYDLAKGTALDFGVIGESRKGA